MVLSMPFDITRHPACCLTGRLSDGSCDNYRHEEGEGTDAVQACEIWKLRILRLSAVAQLSSSRPDGTRLTTCLRCRQRSKCSEQYLKHESCS